LSTRTGEVRPLRLLPRPLLPQYLGWKIDRRCGPVRLRRSHRSAVSPSAKAARLAGKPAWHFALARMSNVELKVSRHARQVWHADLLPWKDAVDRPDKP